ncbi:MAG TPA: hypothetical protein VGO11_00630 [Chthoniobacteraceae bacterium]|nr:hypothetical protein [Chthoniobacteraceae bacterium]
MIFILAAVFQEGAAGWPTKLFSDAEVADRAELIVVGRIKVGSIKRVTREDGGAYRHTAILIVTRTVKGVTQEKELPITIHYGLLPVSARFEKEMNIKPTLPEEPGQATRIFEDNPSEGYFRPTGDIHQDQLWLLHRAGYESPSKTLGVLNPEDIQPATKEQRIKALLSKP